ncbi:hypothetical protein CEY16_08695 [Halalkalibacillus sediminis]|uniref:Uncharacterized protein n=1 Tax=Halalkalibacillus sediminis TaxID=2018042 RepID=A0A2I0QUK6_9BACI|nr:hypothetical protein CEY16_08695 [Halalkalibacillus sediminis]
MIPSKGHQTLRTLLSPMITEHFPFYYDNDWLKHLPLTLLEKYMTPLFLSALYMDDSSLILSKRINHRLKKIYISSCIVLYLQCYVKEALEKLPVKINIV